MKGNLRLTFFPRVPLDSVDHGSDQNAEHGLAAEVDEPHGSGEEPTPLPLEFRDQLHAPQLGGARDGTSWEEGSHHVHGGLPYADPCPDVGDQMMDGRVGLQLGERPHANAARLGDAPQVIALKVDNHRELREVLLAVEEPVALGPVCLRRAAPGDRPLDRARARDGPLGSVIP